MAHVAGLNDFIEGVKILLKDDGVGIFEFPYLREMIDKNEFDTIYHEHLCYYSLTAVSNLFLNHGMIIVDVERTRIHGGEVAACGFRAWCPCRRWRQAKTTPAARRASPPPATAPTFVPLARSPYSKSKTR